MAVKRDLRCRGIPVFADTAKRLPTATTIHYRLGLVLLAQHQALAALAEFRAFQWPERAYRQRDAGMLWMKYDPLLRPLSGDPRFKSLPSPKMHQS